MSSFLHATRYSFRDVAKLLDVHIATIWRWHRDGVRGHKLQGIRIGARRFVLADDLERFLAAGLQDDLGQADDVAGSDALHVKAVNRAD